MPAVCRVRKWLGECVCGHQISRQVGDLELSLSDQIACMVVTDGNVFCSCVPVLAVDQLDGRLIVLENGGRLNFTYM